jgi:hypothetical protein
MAANKASNKGNHTNLNLRYGMTWIAERTGKMGTIDRLAKKVIENDLPDFFLELLVNRR